jgi:3-hydroxyacyl-CoA dehydrogenase
MGTGIAYVSAMSGADVIVVEPSEEHAAKMTATIEQAAASGVQRGKLDADDAAALVARVTRLAVINELPCGPKRCLNGWS